MNMKFILLILAILCIVFSLIGEASPAFQGMERINAEEINNQINNNKIINYDNKYIDGDLKFGHKSSDRSLRSIIKITNSYINGSVYFNDTLFWGPISFNNSYFAYPVYLQNSFFNKNANFHNCNFTSDANFYNSSFAQDAYFYGSQFGMLADFYACNFKNDIYFYDSVFSGAAEFEECNFSGMARFDSDIYSGEAVFSRANFSAEANFENIKYSKKMFFTETIFSGDTRFSGCGPYNESGNDEAELDFSDARFHAYCAFLNAHLNFAKFSRSLFTRKVEFIGSSFSGDETKIDQANFTDYADFSYAVFSSNEIIFDETHFGDYADFYNTAFHGNVSFIDARFLNKVNFNDAIFEHNAAFEDAQFSMDGMFQGSHFQQDVDFVGSRFYENGYFRRSQFSGSVNLDDAQFKDIFFDSSLFQKNAMLHLNGTQFDKIYLRWDRINGSFFKDCRLIYDDEAYLSLIQNYKGLGWVRDANECYLEYKIKYRSHLFGLYWIADFFLCGLYGYGAKPEYAIFWSLILIFACALFFWRNDHMRLKDALTLSGITFLSGTGKLLVTEPPYNPKNRAQLARLAFNTQRLLAGLLIFLFILAVTKTVTI
ncbi:Pentapeptide repeats (9 copies) [uncultured archaeon]|nr:Pentapeptide repeats (9 copies) [uncultured archaeon]